MTTIQDPLAAAVARRDDARGYRLSCIDLLRGLVVVIMALDHVRDNFSIGGMPDPMADPDVGVLLFATRWITHFCAPVFVLLAGVSAGLMTARKAPAELGAFLLKRGLWLIVVEWVVISTEWSFAPLGLPQYDGRTFVVMQVIWAIGASMVVLAAAQFLGRRSCLAIGAAIVLGHNLLDPFWPPNDIVSTNAPLWVGLHAQMSAIVGPFQLVVVYPLLAWIGVMLLGFGMSSVFEQPPAARNRHLSRIGAGLVAAFVAVRAIDVYGDPHPWHLQSGTMATLMGFLNVTKYPPSLHYLLMTLGPAAVLCACADRLRGFVKDALVMFGRVPFAFYVAHFFVIHVGAVLLGLLQGFSAASMCTLFLFYPKGYGVGLGGVYLFWLLLIALLYPFCRWVDGVKARRRDWWLSYV